jgi:protein-tyrosine phosphatase
MQPLFAIERAGAGRLGTMARPRGGRWLGAEMADLAAAGVTVLVSLLTDPEMTSLGLTDEGAAAQAAGLVFLRLPTHDFHVPDRAAAVLLATDLRARLAAGASVVVHCYGGVGRSSTLAAVVLVLEGLTPAVAWDRIAAARGRPVPETAEQRAFVNGLAPECCVAGARRPDEDPPEDRLADEAPPEGRLPGEGPP